MWRKKGRVVAKIIFLWLILGSYKQLKKIMNDVPFNNNVKAQVTRHNALPTKLISPLKSIRLSADNDLARDLNDRNEAKHSHGDETRALFHGPSRHLLFQLPNCTPRAVDHFPPDIFSSEQRKHGWILVHVLLATYMFMALAIVCERYFVPALEVLCEKLNLQTDIAGATFMAAGSSAPELATAVIGVFVTKDDVGLGAVVGSAIYNIMFVISMCALLVTSPIKLHWWPLVRDCLAYLISVVMLVLIIYDSVVQWYESFVLLVMYGLYVLFMRFNERAEARFGSRGTRVCCFSCPEDNFRALDDVEERRNGVMRSENANHAEEEVENWHMLCRRPDGCLWSVLWLLALPLSTSMFLTMPDCRRPGLRNFFWLTFLLSLVWLSFFSFIMVWMITVVGYTANIPDSVMSLTFIAFGVSLPDVVSSVLVARNGLGDMAVSNAIGSNVFDILVCLGVPWFIETCIKAPGSEVKVYSEGLTHSSVMLLTTVIFLLVVTHCNGWRLTKAYGVLLLLVYIIYTALACLYELNIFGYFHPPECPSHY